MTTATFPKYAISKVKYKNFEVNVIGIAKGSGMIAPNMGTMLAYIFTDLNISSNVLQKILTNENDKTFNSITVDSDTSTSDTCLLISTNQSKNKKINNFHDKYLHNFKKCISNIMLNLAKKIVIDGEGAKKIIEIRVENAKSISSAKNIAFSIANSPLVKTAIAGEDANWGRIVMAIGKSYEPINQDKINSAVKISQLHQYIDSLPLGLNTFIGENALTISGGQKQRIIIVDDENSLKSFEILKK